MGRYLTHRYVAVTWTEANRLARLDATPIEEIRYAAEAELVHRTDWWAWWSDELLTTAIGLPEDLRPRGLSIDAEGLITDVWASTTAHPACGWAVLAQVQRVLRCEVLSVGIGEKTYRPPTWEYLMVEYVNGQEGMLYRFWAGQQEGYSCEIRVEPPKEM